MDENPYAVLGVAVDATRAEIRTAYRQLARATHPDRHPNDPDAEARFKAVAAAWDILGDDDKRRAFDLAQGRARSATVAPDEAVDAVAAAVERAQDWAERGVLPQVASRWRGRGAEAVGWAWQEREALVRPGALPEVSWWARRRARQLASEVVVVLAPWPLHQATALFRRRRGWELQIDPTALWRAGFRSTELDDAVMELLVTRYLQILAVARFLPPPTDDGWAEALAEARERDDHRVREQALRVGGWLLLAAVLGLMFTAGYNDW